MIQYGRAARAGNENGGGIVHVGTRVMIKSRHDNITCGQAARFALLVEVARLS
jgi:hypothetical protein